MRLQSMGLVIIGILITIRCVTYGQSTVSTIPDDWFERPITLTGIVTQDPDRGLTNTKIVLGSLAILATLDTSSTLFYGDHVVLTGTIHRPKNFITDTDRIFDYVNYLKVRKIEGIMRVQEYQIHASHQGNRLLEKIFLIKYHTVLTIKKLFPRNEAGLLAGIILGEQSLLEKEVLDYFQTAGLTHIIVLSGSNITLVATGVMMMGAVLGLGYRWRRGVAMMVVPLFVIMTGLGASSVRAGIMTLIMMVLQITTRPTHHLRIIFYTASIMAFVNPRIVLHDPGFHLSFLAYIGIIFITPVLMVWFRSDDQSFFLKKLFIETCSVYIAVLPYILWMSGEVSWLMFVANMMVVPLVPLMMIGGCVATLAAWISYPIGVVLAFPIQWGLSYMVMVARTISKADWGIMVIPPFGGWIVVMVYMVMFGLLVRWHNRCKK